MQVFNQDKEKEVLDLAWSTECELITSTRFTFNRFEITKHRA